MNPAQCTGKAVAHVPPQLNEQGQRRAEMVAWAELLWDIFVSQEPQHAPNQTTSTRYVLTNETLTEKVRLLQ